jgi:predicted phosphodiesterase
VRFHVCHASPKSDMDGIYPDMPSTTTLEGWLDDYQADVLVVGHTHMPLVRKVARRELVVNPGAVLRDPATPLEAPLILDAKTGKFVKGTLVLGTLGVFDTARRRFVARRVTDGRFIDGVVAT